MHTGILETVDRWQMVYTLSLTRLACSCAVSTGVDCTLLPNGAHHLADRLEGTLHFWVISWTLSRGSLESRVHADRYTFSAFGSNFWTSEHFAFIGDGGILWAVDGGAVRAS